MPTLITVTIDPGDGGADYASLAAWEADDYGATSTDLVTNDEQVLALCTNTSATVDTTRVDITATTDATRFIEVRATSKADGYLIAPSGAGDVFAVDADYTVIDGVRVDGVAVTGSAKGVNLTGDECRIVNSQFTQFFAAGQDTVFINTAGVTTRLGNCSFWGVNRGGVLIGNVNNTVTYVHNCTSVGTNVGFSADHGALGYDTSQSITGGSFNVVNCLGANASATGDDFGQVGSLLSGDYCISSDTTAPGANSLLSQTFTSSTAAPAVIFDDAATGDLNLTDNANNVAIQAGVDISADADFPLTDDYLGATRSQTPDVGFHEVETDIDVGGSTYNAVLTAPNSSVSVDTVVSAAVDALALSSPDATVAITVDIEVSAATAALALTEADATVAADTAVSAGTDALTLSAPVGNVSADISVAATPAALSIVAPNATVDVSANVSVSAGVDALSLGTTSANVNAASAVAADSAALAIATLPASVTSSASIVAAAAALALSLPAAAVSLNVSVEASTASLAITEFNAAVEIGAEVIVPSAVAALGLTVPSATVAAATNIGATMGALTLTAPGANVNVVGSTEVLAATSALSIATASGTVALNFGVEAGAAVLSTGTPPAAVLVDLIVPAGVANLGLTSSDALVSSGGDTLVESNPLSLALGSPAASVIVSQGTRLLGQIEADWQAFLYPTEFALPWSTPTASGVGMLDEESTEGNERINARVYVQTAVVPGLQRGDPFTIKGRTRRIIGIQPDGFGATEIVLEFIL